MNLCKSDLQNAIVQLSRRITEVKKINCVHVHVPVYFNNLWPVNNK